jgi:hypothetical protein
MKNPYEVLKMKEQEIDRVRSEVEALRVVAGLLDEDQATSPADDKINLHHVIEMP